VVADAKCTESELRWSQWT